MDSGVNEMTEKRITYQRTAPERGYTDRVLRVDLTRKEIKVEEVSAEMREMFVGGRGYCLKLVFDGTSGGTKYDSPENVLALAGGPFCGETGFVGTGKFIAGTISPLTGTFCDSNVGGHFFPLVKISGFDAIAITGKSDEDVMLVIDGDAGEVFFTEAPAMDGALIGAEELVEEWRGEGKQINVAYINAGNGAKNTFFGCINSVYYDTRRKRCRAKQAGRGGTGTVMRDKGLWGVLVRCNAKRAGSNRPADRERVRRAGKNLRDVIREVDPNSMSLGTQGTTALMDMMNAFHLLPVNNYQYGVDEREKAVSGFVFEKEYFKQKTPDGCYIGCNLACTKGHENHKLLTGPYKGKRVGVDGPEYESAAAMTNLGVFSIPWIMEFNWYCDQYGLDTISTGVTTAFAFEAFEQGYLVEEDTGGRKLEWGNAELVMELVHETAGGEEGFASVLARGLRRTKLWIADRASKRTGRPESGIINALNDFAMECKGLEFSMYITKESLAQQGGYGFALKGAQHDEAWLIAIDQLNRELPAFEKKAVALRWFPLFRTWFNIAGLCKLPWIDVRNPEAKNTPMPARNMPTVDYYIEFVNGTLGTEKTLEDLLLESERSYTLHKLINLRQGFGTREHDNIPLRAMAPVFMNEFLSRKEYYEEYLTERAGLDIAGRSDEEMLKMLHGDRRERYEKLTDAVYSEKGYDANGIPTDETMKRMGLDAPEYMQIVRAARKRSGNRN